MSRYIMIRRLRFPAILLLVGVIALLNETGVLDQFWQWFVPLLLILLGVIMLAERAALAVEGGYPPYPGADPRTATGIPPYPGQPQAYVPPDQPSVPPQPWDSGKNSEGGQ
jgi:Zn-dependent protease